MKKFVLTAIERRIISAIITQGETAMLEGRAGGNACPIDFDSIKALRQLLLNRGGFPSPRKYKSRKARTK